MTVPAVHAVPAEIQICYAQQPQQQQHLALYVAAVDAVTAHYSSHYLDVQHLNLKSETLVCFVGHPAERAVLCLDANTVLSRTCWRPSASLCLLACLVSEPSPPILAGAKNQCPAVNQEAVSPLALLSASLPLASAVSAVHAASAADPNCAALSAVHAVPAAILTQAAVHAVAVYHAVAAAKLVQ